MGSMTADHGPARAPIADHSRTPRASASVLALALALTLALLLTPGVSARQLAQAPAADSRPAAESRPTADNVTVQELTRIAGHGSTVLRGIGIVTGLGKGKGDKGSELALARPLAKVYEANGNPLPDLRELAKAENAALVALEVVIPAQGAQMDDEFDIRVTTLHSATNLAGGQLMISPISGPLPGQGVFAMGAGTLYLEDAQTPTSAVIRGGARIVRPITMPAIVSRLTLTLMPQYRYHTVSARIAEAINGALSDPQDAGEDAQTTGSGLSLAQAIDDTTIVVRIPDQERGNVPQFVGMIMGTQVTLGLLQQPAEVRVNPRTGSIVFSGNVEISPVAVSHKNLVITTIIQPPAQPGRPIPAPAGPQRVTDRMVAIDTSGRGRERARIQDLLAAFRQLDVPVEDRINIITQLHRAGRLHARLVVE